MYIPKSESGEPYLNDFAVVHLTLYQLKRVDLLPWITWEEDNNDRRSTKQL
jgi:hypothetical protein